MAEQEWEMNARIAEQEAERVKKLEEERAAIKAQQISETKKKEDEDWLEKRKQEELRKQGEQVRRELIEKRDKRYADERLPPAKTKKEPRIERSEAAYRRFTELQTEMLNFGSSGLDARGDLMYAEFFLHEVWGLCFRKELTKENISKLIKRYSWNGGQLRTAALILENYLPDQRYDLTIGEAMSEFRKVLTEMVERGEGGFDFQKR